MEILKDAVPSGNDRIAFDDAAAQCCFAAITLPLHRHATIGLKIGYGLVAVKYGDKLPNRFKTHLIMGQFQRSQ